MFQDHMESKMMKHINKLTNNVDTNQIPNECYPKDILSPKELLPQDTESTKISKCSSDGQEV